MRKQDVVKVLSNKGLFPFDEKFRLEFPEISGDDDWNTAFSRISGEKKTFAISYREFTIHMTFLR